MSRSVRALSALAFTGAVSVILACGGMEAASPAAMESAADTAGGEESITNNQEEGVDEGGIVKAWGDHLIVLRRGRLFTIRVGERDLSPTCQVDAYPDRSLGTWYDELLVHERTVVVIGYSYSMSATEIGLFELDGQGCIEHRSTHFLRSNDYYSSRNYASRLVNGKLVFYMPHSVGTSEIEPELVLASAPPAMSSYENRVWRSVISPVDVHVPGRPPGQSTLHTVVTCDLERGMRNGELDCGAHAILGAWGRTFYVSRDAVYVWVSDGRGESDGEPGAIAYRLPFGQEAPGALRVYGVPTDQFSFKERDGELNVLVRAEGGGDWMANAERGIRRGGVALASIPVGDFGARGVPSVAPERYTPLPAPPEGQAFQNRFVGDFVLYGVGTSWGHARQGTRASLFAHRYAGDEQRFGEPTRRLALRHGVDRIEALGRDAVVVGSDGSSLQFSSVMLRGRPALIDRYTIPGASQGETRSHGFFYKPGGHDHGVLGLPIRRGGPGYEHLYRGSAEMLFLDVDALHFERLGRLVARNDEVDDDCEVSCVDWYGNARPIFYRGRVFALLGYELVEGIVRRGRIVEVDRVHLIRDLSS